jgi:hypothetical protein
MAATSAQTRALGFRVAASAVVVALLAVILLVVMAPWPAASTASSAVFSEAEASAGGTVALESARLSAGKSVAGPPVARNEADADGHLGIIDAGAARICRISVLCPRRTGSDSVGGGSVSVAFDWSAVAGG